jgi:predicted CxxxxCH...CXXCH cytochrome family protein
MSSIKPSHVLLTALLAFALGGCGDRNDKAVYSPEGGHLSDWVIIHKTSARADVLSCAECHGENYDGGISKVSCTNATAVSGFTCHAISPVASSTGCVSCHGGLPSGPFGSAAPNRKAAHTTHTALPGVDCAACHLNAGSGTVGHAKANAAGGRNSATVAGSAFFPFAYNADGTCSSVSCHGGKVTPAWAGSITIVANDNSICLKCHEQGTALGVPQYNSFYSGSYSGTDPATNTHASHLGRGASCTDCHNIGTLTNYQKHFGGILSKSFTTPGDTIGSSPTKIGAYAASSKTCSSFSAGCHVNVRNWIQ